MKFTDNKNREWTLFINVAAMRRAKAKGIDLSMPVSQLLQFVMDDVFIADALWSIVSPDAKERGIDSEAFDSALGGAIFDSAREALWAALEQYYDPKAERAIMLRATLAQVKLETAKMLSSTLGGSTNAKENSATT